MHSYFLTGGLLTLLYIQLALSGFVERSNEILLSPDEPSYVEDSEANEDVSQKLNELLKDLLDLNDGELRPILSGASVPEVADRLSPATSLLLASSHQKFDDLQTSLQDNRALPGDLRIAKRKKFSQKPSRVQNESSDSLLSTLTEISRYLKSRESKKDNTESEVSNKRKLKSVKRKRSRNVHHHSKPRAEKSLKKGHSFHPEYFFRPEVCPANDDGLSRLFCPTPDSKNRWKCILPQQLCDDTPHCPNSEDEHPSYCLFYIPTRDQLDEIFYILGNVMKFMKISI